jgi:hypothetical protein
MLANASMFVTKTQEASRGCWNLRRHLEAFHLWRECLVTRTPKSTPGELLRRSNTKHQISRVTNYGG